MHATALASVPNQIIWRCTDHSEMYPLSLSSVIQDVEQQAKPSESQLSALNVGGALNVSLVN